MPPQSPENQLPHPDSTSLDLKPADSLAQPKPPRTSKVRKALAGGIAFLTASGAGAAIAEQHSANPVGNRLPVAAAPAPAAVESAPAQTSAAEAPTPVSSSPVSGVSAEAPATGNPPVSGEQTVRPEIGTATHLENTAQAQVGPATHYENQAQLGPATKFTNPDNGAQIIDATHYENPTPAVDDSNLKPQAPTVVDDANLKTSQTGETSPTTLPGPEAGQTPTP